MEALERLSVSKDWITLLFLGIVFLLVIANLFHSKRLKQLVMLPYSDNYLLNVSLELLQTFNIILFIASNLVLGLFLYLINVKLLNYPIESGFKLYISTLGVILAYWIFKFFIGKIIAFLFEFEKQHNKLIITKISYFFSSSIYLLIFLIFAFYFFDKGLSFLYITIVVYGILLSIRYFHFLRRFKSGILSNIFYFILYLCALEIAPLIIAIKIGL